LEIQHFMMVYEEKSLVQEEIPLESLISIKQTQFLQWVGSLIWPVDFWGPNRNVFRFDVSRKRRTLRAGVGMWNEFMEAKFWSCYLHLGITFIIFPFSIFFFSGKFVWPLLSSAESSVKIVLFGFNFLKVYDIGMLSFDYYV